MADLPVSNLPPGALYHSGPRRCAGCGFPPNRCYCGELPRISCRTRVLIVRHAAERRKASNTGGLAATVLGAQLVEHGLPHQPLDLTGHLGPNPRLLLPHGPSTVDEPPSTLVVIDATWHQTRSMRARIAPLPSVPVLSLPPPRVQARMRLQHLPEGRSTMEALADALELLGEPEPAEVLRALYVELAQRWLALRQADPALRFGLER